MPDIRTILILDHGRCIADRIRPALYHAGCTVLHYEDGEDAWAHALKTRVDCFVIDAELPYSDDGIYFIENIRAKPFYAQTPIYGLFSEPMDAQHPSTHYRSYFRAGITASFVKDSGIDDLLQTILRTDDGQVTGAPDTGRSPGQCAATTKTWRALLELLDRAGRPDAWI